MTSRKTTRGSAAAARRVVPRSAARDVRVRVKACAVLLQHLAGVASDLADGPEPESGAAILANLEKDLASDLAFFREVTRRSAS